MNLKVKKLYPDAKLPTKATPESSCYDVYSVEEVKFMTWTKRMVPTGLAFELPPGMSLDIRPRSGLASQGFIILNSPGTLDSDYRGELLISCMSLSTLDILIEKGDRIAQIRLFRTIDIEFEEVKELDETSRGEGGFGSTGR